MQERKRIIGRWRNIRMGRAETHFFCLVFMLSVALLFPSKVVSATKSEDSSRPVTCVLNQPKKKDHAVCPYKCFIIF